MSKYATLIAQIAANIRRNGAQAITGDLLQEQLLAMITSLGEYYQFGGLVSQDTEFTPGDEPVVFIAATPGTYTDFGGLVVADGEVALLVWSGSAWSKQTTDIATRSEVSQLGQLFPINKNNIYIIPFPTFTITENVSGDTITLVFSANPFVYYNGNIVSLFNSNEEFSIVVPVNNVVYIPNSTIKGASGSIGKTNFLSYNWTNNPVTEDCFILALNINGIIAREVGAVAPYLIKSDITADIADINGDIADINGDIQELNKVLFNNAFLLNFPKASLEFPAINKIVFSANPQIWYNGKIFSLFAPTDAVGGKYILDTSSVTNAVAYIPTSYLDSLPNGASIGLSNITILNWTNTPNLKDKVILCLSIPYVFSENIGSYSAEIGILAPYIRSYQIDALNNQIDAVSSDINNIKPKYELDYSKTIEIIKPFLSKYRSKSSDVTIVINGDSISEHPQDYGTSLDFKTNPPLLARYNYASLLFKKLVWDGQMYRRADGTEQDTGYIFTETGDWNTANSVQTMLDDWDDSSNITGTGWRGGYTRYSGMSGANSVSFEVPADAWAFNFIYRKDIHGGIMNVTISEGNGKLQVWNGSNWMEANGYQFNTLQTADYANGVGNTMYQVRLKFRSFDKNGTLDTRGTTKTITISKVNNDSRLCYWGVEWSPAEFMFTLINSSRGSQNLDEMKQTIKTELYDRDADLFVFQAPLINMGVIPSLNSVTPEEHLNAIELFLAGIKNNADNWQDYQCIMMLPNLYLLSDSWKEGTNEYKLIYNQIAKRMLSTRDYYDVFSENFFNNNEIGFVNTFNAFMAEILNYFSTYAQGLAASSPTGNTFTDDGTHPNHKGSDTFYKYIIPLFLN